MRAPAAITQPGRVRAAYSFTSAELAAQRTDGVVDDVHLCEQVVVDAVEEFTAVGDLVLDPFAGYGTTLVVASRMGRQVVGVELDESKVELIRRRLAPGARILHGDARELARVVSGPVDLCVTSPPYMSSVDHPQNPLTAYRTLDGDYARYLDELGAILADVAALLRPGGHLVVSAANIEENGVETPLAQDIAERASRHLALRQQISVEWDHPPSWMSADCLLVFGKPDA